MFWWNPHPLSLYVLLIHSLCVYCMNLSSSCHCLEKVKVASYNSASVSWPVWNVSLNHWDLQRQFDVLKVYCKSSADVYSRLQFHLDHAWCFKAASVQCFYFIYSTSLLTKPCRSVQTAHFVIESIYKCKRFLVFSPCSQHVSSITFCHLLDSSVSFLLCKSVSNYSMSAVSYELFPSLYNGESVWTLLCCVCKRLRCIWSKETHDRDDKVHLLHFSVFLHFCEEIVFSDVCVYEIDNNAIIRFISSVAVYKILTYF